MLSSRKYLCPKVCPGRSGHCHESCERHAKYREAREAELEEIRRLAIPDCLHVSKYERRWAY